MNSMFLGSMKYESSKREVSSFESFGIFDDSSWGVSLVHAEDANPDTVLAGTPYEGTLTGNINVVSKYILRGITQTYGPKLADGSKGTDGPEMDSPALQGGLDYVLKNGLYVGYWFSTLGYSYADLNPDHTGKHSQNSTGK